MSQTVEVKVPDIGDFSDIPVIEIGVKVGDTIALDDSLVTLESDKATMDVPSSVAGVVKEIKVAVGDRLSQGAVVAIVEVVGETAAPRPPKPSQNRRPPQRRRPWRHHRPSPSRLHPYQHRWPQAHRPHHCRSPPACTPARRYASLPANSA